ncbi:MAG: class I SAM-dependent methyltransferase [Myxococcota bacterium]
MAEPQGMQAAAEPPRNEFVDFWNEILADKFERFRHILMEGLSHHSDVPLRRLELEPGSRVLDVGCGWGDTALQLACKVGPTGKVVGIDCTERFLEKARADAAEAGASNVEFIAADVESHPFEERYDFAFSRFGMMFFARPVAAMRNIHRALEPGATLMFIVWRDIMDNPWMAVPKEVVSRFLPPPGEGAKTCGPGPFSMASADMVSAQLLASGFEDVSFRRNDGPVMVGRTPEEAMQAQLALGPAGEIFREAGDEAERRRGEIEAALRSELAAYEKDGAIMMDSSSWTITATKPA